MLSWPNMKKVYKKASKDTLFINDIRDADGDLVPDFFSSYEDKVIFVATYYGWCVGKYGAAFWSK